ncbi:PIR Superfamily Protein, partial [Plasmodium malariae]
MTTDTTEENNTLTLYVKYKNEFETAIKDIQNIIGGGENPGKKCAQMRKYLNFITPCQDIGRYLIEIKELYNHDSLKRCKYLNYRINSDEKYYNSSWFQGYKDFSSQIENICIKEIKNIPEYSLENLKKLYGYYDDFSKFKGKDKDSDGHICKSVTECHEIYMNNYQECQNKSNDSFCEELINFKNAYDYKMNNFTPCNGLPLTLPQIEKTSTQILSPEEEVDYLFVPILTTAIVLLMSFTTFFLYK